MARGATERSAREWDEWAAGKWARLVGRQRESERVSTASQSARAPADAAAGPRGTGERRAISESRLVRRGRDQKRLTRTPSDGSDWRLATAGARWLRLEKTRGREVQEEEEEQEEDFELELENKSHIEKTKNRTSANKCAKCRNHELETRRKVISDIYRHVVRRGARGHFVCLFIMHSCHIARANWRLFARAAARRGARARGQRA